MFSRDIPSYPLDLTGQAETNKVVNEYYRRTDTERDTVFVPLSGPFYIRSMVLTDPSTQIDYVEGKDYTFFGICAEITAFVKNKEVGMCIHWLNPAVTEWYASYQVVGHFSYLQRELIDLTQSVINDARPVWYKDIKHKPLWFPPELHRHDLRYEIHSFTDLIACIKRIGTLKQNQLNPIKTGTTHLIDNLMQRIDVWEKSIQESLAQHEADSNAHGLTATQVGLGNVDNFLTANLTETINGSRRDRHLTMDNVDQAIRQATTSLTQLTQSGSLPLLRYGTNSFIPAPITGSFEGQGANNYKMGFNVEPGGEALILANRNDGRVNGLYFMSNTEKGIPTRDWKYTAYRYQHQTATDAGVNLYVIVQGSSGKFMIVGGDDKAGKRRWYYTTGNGTFDPNKHILTPLPDAIINTIDDVSAGESGTHISNATISSATFPDRIMLWIPMTGTWIMSSPWKLNFYDLPEGDEDKTSFSGVALPSANSGQLCWEYSLTEKVWRQVIFTFHPAGYPDKQYTSPLYFPFRYKIVKVTDDNPRPDGSSAPYGLKGYEYTFNHPITNWTNRVWGYTVLDKYDADRDMLAIKCYDSSYGQDGRPFTLEGGDIAYGLLLKNRTVTGTQTHFDVTNGFGLEDKLYTFDVTQGGHHFEDYDGPGLPHADNSGKAYVGSVGSVSWMGTGVIYGIGSITYGSFPLAITSLDVRNLAEYATPENWAKSTLFPYRANNQRYIYNEHNTSGFTIGAHSVFYLQLDPNDVTTFGGVGYSSDGMVFRRQDALDANGIAREPYVDFTLYGKAVKGYPLDNTSYTFTGQHSYPYVTNLFAAVPNNRRQEYMKHLIGHDPFPNATAESVNINNAVHRVATEHRVVITGHRADIVATKTYDLKDQLTNNLFPYMIEQGKAQGWKIIGPNLAACYRIGFTNLASTRYEQLLICTGIVFQEASNVMLMLSTCFNLTGGTEQNGLVTGATITPVGNVWVDKRTTVTDGAYQQYIQPGQSFLRGTGYDRTQPRDVARQMDNGKSFCLVHHSLYVTVKANINVPGTALVIGEDGIESTWGFDQYWTAGEYEYFIHPYYGVCNRRQAGISAASAQIGWPYPRDIATHADFVYDRSRYVLGNANYLQSAYTVYINNDQNVKINGTPYTLKATQIDLHTIDSDPSNGTYYLYLIYGSSGPEYSIVSSPLPETASCALLSTIKTNKDSIYEIENYNVFSMNGFRISAVRHGSVIPSATGSIDAAGQAKGWVDQ